MNDVPNHDNLITYSKFIPIYYKKSIIKLLCHHINKESLRISINSFEKYIGLKEINKLLVSLVLVCKDFFNYISKLIYVYVSPPPIFIPTSIQQTRFTSIKHVSIYKKSSIKVIVINLMKTPSRPQPQQQNQQLKKHSNINSTLNNEENMTTFYDILKVNSMIQKFKNTTKLNIVSDLDVYFGTSIDRTTLLHKINFNTFTIYRLAIKSNRYELPSVYEKVMVSLKIETFPIVGGDTNGNKNNNNNKRLITEVKEKSICQYDKQKYSITKEMSLFHLQNGNLNNYFKYVPSFESDTQTKPTTLSTPISNRRIHKFVNNNNTHHPMVHKLLKLLIITILIIIILIYLLIKIMYMILK